MRKRQDVILVLVVITCIFVQESFLLMEDAGWALPQRSNIFQNKKSKGSIASLPTPRLSEKESLDRTESKYEPGTSEMVVENNMDSSSCRNPVPAEQDPFYRNYDASPLTSSGHHECAMPHSHASFGDAGPCEQTGLGQGPSGRPRRFRRKRPRRNRIICTKPASLRAKSERTADIIFRFIYPKWRYLLCMHDPRAREEWLHAFRTLVPLKLEPRGKGRKKGFAPDVPIVGQQPLDLFRYFVFCVTCMHA
jgi:hypothetical protein